MNIRKELMQDIILLAIMALEELTEEEIQEFYGSDYYSELKTITKRLYGRFY